jgi:hypothetical protein
MFPLVLLIINSPYQCVLLAECGHALQREQ